MAAWAFSLPCGGSTVSSTSSSLTATAASSSSSGRRPGAKQLRRRLDVRALYPYPRHQRRGRAKQTHAPALRFLGLAGGRRGRRATRGLRAAGGRKVRPDPDEPEGGRTAKLRLLARP